MYSTFFTRKDDIADYFPSRSGYIGGESIRHNFIFICMAVHVVLCFVSLCLLYIVCLFLGVPKAGWGMPRTQIRKETERE